MSDWGCEGNRRKEEGKDEKWQGSVKEPHGPRVGCGVEPGGDWVI